MNKKISSILIAGLLSLTAANAQKGGERIEPIAYGNMDSWLVREVTESFVIGGATKYLYEIAPSDSLFDNTPYKNSKSSWASSTVMARVKGVTKASITVYPEKRDKGFAARLETRIENVKVLGLININVLASGTIFLGEMLEPITDTNNPQSKLITGISFTGRPSALEYDYRVTTGGSCIKATGFGRQQKLDKKDKAEVQLLLQHRWEDKDGNIHAKRVATGWELFSESVETWQNKHRLPISYGDITKEFYYEPYMDLRHGDKAYYAQNSKGIMVPIQEESWADANEEVTHIVLQFSSSNGGAYIGNTSSKLWIDNVKLVYPK